MEVSGKLNAQAALAPGIGGWVDVLKKKTIVSQNGIRTFDRPVLFGSPCDHPPGFGYQKRS